MSDSKQHSEPDVVSRETALTLIEDAKRWSEAYMKARDELRDLQEQLEAMHDALAEIAKGDNYDGADYSSLARAVLASGPARKPDELMTTQRDESQIKEYPIPYPASEPKAS